MNKLTLDEAIKHCEDIAESCECEAGRCDETDRYESSRHDETCRTYTDEWTDDRR